MNRRAEHFSLITLVIAVILTSYIIQAVNGVCNLGIGGLFGKLGSQLETEGLEHLELIYNPSPPPAIFPIERWVKNGIIVINRGSNPIGLRFNVFSIYDGNEVEVSPFPQPNFIYLQPGENQTIWYFLDVSYRTGISPEEEEGIHYIKVKVVIEDVENPSSRKEFYIDHVIKVVPPSKYEPNALIEGYVFDANTGEPLANVEVCFEGANGAPVYRTVTDEKGHYSIKFYAHRYSDTGAYHGYCLSVGGVFRKAFFPKPGDRIFYNVSLTASDYKIESKYRIIAKYSTGYPIWLADLDEEERYIVFASGHHEIMNVDPNKHGIYFFDTNGTLLWRYPTKYQVWGIDVSDDGEYVAASFLGLEKAILFRKDGTIIWDTEKLGYGRFESREIKISHNGKYVAIGTTPGDLLLLDLKTGKLVWKVFLNGQIRGIVFTADDSLIYASSGDGYIYKISVATGEVLGRAYVEAWTPRYSLTLSEDERYIVTVSKIGRICLVDAVEMRPLWSFDARGGGHWTLITPDNELILAGSGGSYGLIALTRNGSVLWFTPFITSARAFIANKTLILAANRVIDFKGRVLYEFKELPADIDFIHVTRDESKIIAIDGKGTLYILEGKLKIEKVKPEEKPPVLINLDEVPEVKRSYEEALKGRFGGGGLESVDFKAMVELGVTWKRMGFDILNPDFKLMDNQVMACQKAGIILHVIIDLPFPQIPPDEFARRVREIVERYDGDGVNDMPELKFPVRHYEIMNEIHGRPGWSLETYKEYYVKAYETIKEACSECRVSPSSFVGPDEEYLRFLRESDLKFDFLSYHSYVDYLEIDELMGLLQELGFKNIEIWITESQFGGMERKLNRSEHEVAEALVKSYIYALARGIAKVTPSELDAKEYFPEGLKHSCLIDVDGRRKPAFYAYKALIKMIDGFNEASVISRDPFLAEFRFDDKVIYVAWGRGKLLLKGFARLIDLYGRELGEVDLSEYELKDELVYIVPAKPALKVSPEISITLSKTKVTVGEEVAVSGFISPFKGPARITLVIGSPKGVLTKEMYLDEPQFSYVFKVDVEGEWSIQVRVEENEYYYSASSKTLTLIVEKREGKKCIIATVSFGSELSPEVNFLRNFRDNYILSTFAGKSFYLVFDPFYYSWSTPVANFIKDSDVLKVIVRTLIYPLIWILKLSTVLSLFLFNVNPEAGAVVIGSISSILIGITYLAPIVLVVLLIRKARLVGELGNFSQLPLVLVGLLVLIAISVLLRNTILAAISTSTYVLVLLLSSGIIVGRKLAETVLKRDQVIR